MSIVSRSDEQPSAQRRDGGDPRPLASARPVSVAVQRAFEVESGDLVHVQHARLFAQKQNVPTLALHPVHGRESDAISRDAIDHLHRYDDVLSVSHHRLCEVVGDRRRPDHAQRGQVYDCDRIPRRPQLPINPVVDLQEARYGGVRSDGVHALEAVRCAVEAPDAYLPILAGRQDGRVHQNGGGHGRGVPVYERGSASWDVVHGYVSRAQPCKQAVVDAAHAEYDLIRRAPAPRLERVLVHVLHVQRERSLLHQRHAAIHVACQRQPLDARPLARGEQIQPSVTHTAHSERADSLVADILQVAHSLQGVAVEALGAEPTLICTRSISLSSRNLPFSA
ncbi:aminoglycoside phosphotransferase, putative [Babesia ovata]|uniref:Aminoglycoside phosphotransferase, putative n=1 Tax=Babesia ovata TaxID=189622 RepID=A0A2H6K9Q3_9APIC|nr:aminoglycoside phosphotransferase, putative [Babesia ovata]GBE59721.1 aminoglycoside phosphotransferase, putative [Babesia ovata]